MFLRLIFLLYFLLPGFHMKPWFTLPKDLTFLGCLFKCPNNFNDSTIMFPEVAAKTKIPKHVKNPVKFCKNLTNKNDRIFGVCNKVCVHGSSLHLVIPHDQLERNEKKSCHKKMRVYSFVGDLYDRERRSIDDRKRQYIASPSIISRSKVHRVGNLFLNNDFELTSYKKNQLILYWSCQGDDSKYRPMYSSTNNPKHGKYAGSCTERKNERQGPGQHIEKIVDGDGIYRVRGWTKLLNNVNKDELASIELWLKWKKKDSNFEEKKLLAQRNKLINNTGWVYWATQFHLPDELSFSDVHIFFKGPKSYIDILVDSMSLELLRHNDEWKLAADNQIDKIRRRDVTIRVAFDRYQYTKHELANTKLELKQLSSVFGFGAAVHYDALVNNKKYRQFLKDHFEWATLESSLKWSYMEQNQGISNHTKSDKMLKILEELHINVRGHCLFWESPDQVPNWVVSLPNKDLKSAMRKRMINVVLRYRQKVKHWDVNNEMLQDNFFVKKLGADIRNWMFEGTHQLDPKAKLFVNEMDVLAAPFLTQSYLEFVKLLKDEGVPISGIGVQGHFTNSAHPEIIKDRLDILAHAGLPIWITEFDIKEQDENKRANILETVMRVAYSHSSVHGIILWSFWDRHSWRGNDTSLFEGEDFKPNEVGKLYLRLRNEWKTTPQVLRPLDVTRNATEFNFKAFHGKHLVTITLPDGETIEKEIMIANHNRELLVDFKAHENATNLAPASKIEKRNWGC